MRKRPLFCDPKIPVFKRISAFYSTCVPTVFHGSGEWAFTQGMFQSLRSWELGKLRRILCFRRRPNEGWGDYMKRTGLIVAKQLKKHNQLRIQNLSMKRVKIAAWQMASCPNDAKGRRYLGGNCDLAMRQALEGCVCQIVKGGLQQQSAVEKASNWTVYLLGITVCALLRR